MFDNTIRQLLQHFLSQVTERYQHYVMLTHDFSRGRKLRNFKLSSFVLTWNSAELQLAVCIQPVDALLDSPGVSRGLKGWSQR